MITLEEAKAQGPSMTAGQMCWAGKRSRPGGGEYVCTLALGHEGIHVAHGPGDDVMGAWKEGDEWATEL